MLSKLSLWAIGLAIICGCNVTVQGQSGAGLSISKVATAENVGLPVYPGAKPSPESSNDSPSVSLGLWGGAVGFKLAVMKLESPDSPGAIATYYQKALEKYGTVLECGGSAARVARSSTGALNCDNDKPEPGGRLFKAGTEERQHIVAIEPKGAGSRFHLVYVEAHD